MESFKYSQKYIEKWVDLVSHLASFSHESMRPTVEVSMSDPKFLLRLKYWSGKVVHLT